jgi:hypothetical protein
MMRFVSFVASAPICLSLLLANAKAADLITIEEPAPVAERMAPEWTFAIDPLNGWLPGFKGDTRVFGVNASIDITAWDLIQNLDELLHALDGFYEGSGEFRYRQFGLQYDVVYLDLAGSKQFGGNVISGSLDAAFKYTTWTLAGNYRFYETPTAYADLIAGARFTDVTVDLDLTLASLGFEASDGDSWVDPVVGVKGRYNLDPHWYLKGSALYGGFGVGSDWVYDLSGFVGYEWNNGIELFAGWRITDTDYENGSFKWDMQLSGPMMGLTIKF